MKFLYINNDLCAGCDRCSGICPTGAIYVSGGKKYIDYDKCVSCGNCFRECLHHAISIEKIERITREIDRLDEHRMRIEHLERENRRLREESSALLSGFRTLIRKFPVAVALADGNGFVLCANPEFMELTGTGNGKNTSDAGAYENLRQSLPSDLYDLVMNTARGGEDIDGKLVRLGKHPVSFSVYAVGKRDMAVVLLRELRSASVKGDEVVRRVKGSIDRQMSMVQKIGFLLGEEVSEISKNLDSVIKIAEEDSHAG